MAVLFIPLLAKRICENPPDAPISKSDLKYNGQVVDLIPFILDERRSIKINGKIISKRIDFEEIIKISEINNDVEEKYSTVLPDWINVDLNISTDEYIYQNFISKNTSLNIHYNNKDLKLEGGLDVNNFTYIVSGHKSSGVLVPR